MMLPHKNGKLAAQFEFDFSGLQCPECGSTRLSTTQTLMGVGAVLRRRKCANGHTFVTREVVSTREEYNSADRKRINDRRLKAKKD